MRAKQDVINECNSTRRNLLNPAHAKGGASRPVSHKHVQHTQHAEGVAHNGKLSEVGANVRERVADGQKEVHGHAPEPKLGHWRGNDEQQHTCRNKVGTPHGVRKNGRWLEVLRE